jgi:UDP-N-acetylglucosamine 2-epimerase (non-hydrolysing)/GDP/UDP-N,N'-diacetylbacillosamine 2-epimerase (hydrolysing)
MAARRKIAVFTGSRSEYGLQYPVLTAIARDPRLEYYLLAGGAHLREDFGRTAAEIESDGFRIHREVQIQVDADCKGYTAQSIGAGITSISSILAELQPDFTVVYGDRFETFAAMIASTQMNIPTAHIEGGDYTEGGALDDSVRHAMTKLAHIHFTTNAAAADRVRALGEESWRIYLTGLPALDLIAAGQFAPSAALLEEFGFDLSQPIVLFCQHSVTTERDRAASQIQPSLEALRQLAREHYQMVLTYPNDDSGGKAMIRELKSFAAEKCPAVHLVPSLGRSRFHGILNLIGRVGKGALVGNSSAGIKESPAFGCPVVNIGSRQQGRLRSTNVLDVPYDADAILNAIRRCSNDEAFRETCRTCENPYGSGGAGAKIAEVLATIPIDARLLQKKMTF